MPNDDAPSVPDCQDGLEQPVPSDAEAKADRINGIWALALLFAAFGGVIGWMLTDTVAFQLLWPIGGAVLGAVVGNITVRANTDHSRKFRRLERATKQGPLTTASDADLVHLRGPLKFFAVFCGGMGAVFGGISGTFAGQVTGEFGLQILFAIIGAVVCGALAAVVGAARYAQALATHVAFRDVARQYMLGQPALAATCGAVAGAFGGGFAGWQAAAAVWPQRTLTVALCLGTVAAVVGALAGWQKSTRVPP